MPIAPVNATAAHWKVRLEPVAVSFCDVSEARLVFVQDVLAAVLVRLSDDFEIAELAGAWFVEAAFGDFDVACGKAFGSLAEVEKCFKASILPE